MKDVCGSQSNLGKNVIGSRQFFGQDCLKHYLRYTSTNIWLKSLIKFLFCWCGEVLVGEQMEMILTVCTKYDHNYL